MSEEYVLCDSIRTYTSLHENRQALKKLLKNLACQEFCLFVDLLPTKAGIKLLFIICPLLHYEVICFTVSAL